MLPVTVRLLTSASERLTVVVARVARLLVASAGKRLRTLLTIALLAIALLTVALRSHPLLTVALLTALVVMVMVMMMVRIMITTTRAIPLRSVPIRRSLRCRLRSAKHVGQLFGIAETAFGSLMKE